MKKITVKELEALSIKDDGKWIALGNSVYGKVRAGSSGRISLYVEWRYKTNGKTKSYSIGTWQSNGSLSLKAIRDVRDSLSAELKSGVDPLERRATEKLRSQANLAEGFAFELERLEKSAEQNAKLTVRELFDIWKNLELKKRKDGGSEALRAFERDVFPIIGNIAAESVTKQQIQKIVDQMMTRDVVRMTKRVLADIRQMFGFAFDRELIVNDPTARIKKASIGKDNERERVLSEQELIDLMCRIPASGLAKTSALALLIQLTTLVRIGELSNAAWADVDFSRKEWVLPITKNGRSHKIFLSDFALSRLKELREITGLTDWLLPNSKLDGPLNSKTITKQVADRQREKAPMSGRTKKIDALTLTGGGWRPHDLRRTGASLMAELGTLPDVIERCLNHTEENKMKRIYQRATFEGAMRNAWQILGERIELLSNLPSNVITLKVG